MQTENIVNFFKSPADLRAHVINSLSKLSAARPQLDLPLRQRHPSAARTVHRTPLHAAANPPARRARAELNLLTDWVAKPDAEIYRARILNVVAIGGMGKSALTWKWFNNIAPQEMKPLAGPHVVELLRDRRHLRNFVTRALAYVSRRPREEVQQIPAPERETQLLAALDREPFLLVLDGLERILIAYARMDAAHLGRRRFDRGRRTSSPSAGLPGAPRSRSRASIGCARPATLVRAISCVNSPFVRGPHLVTRALPRGLQSGNR